MVVGKEMERESEVSTTEVACQEMSAFNTKHLHLLLQRPLVSDSRFASPGEDNIERHYPYIL